MASEQQLISTLAQRYGVDPNAALAIASVEGGFNGAVGDNGTSFGPFQLHEGGALPNGRGSQWANSPAGIDYAMRHIASVAHGLHGQSAVAAISRGFERPANPSAEISKAMQRYGNVGGGVGGFSGGINTLPINSPQGGGMDMQAVVAQLVQNMLSTPRRTFAPQVDQIPVQLALGGNYGSFGA